MPSGRSGLLLRLSWRKQRFGGGLEVPFELYVLVLVCWWDEVGLFVRREVMVWRVMNGEKTGTGMRCWWEVWLRWLAGSIQANKSNSDSKSRSREINIGEAQRHFFFFFSFLSHTSTHLHTSNNGTEGHQEVKRLQGQYQEEEHRPPPERRYATLIHRAPHQNQGCFLQLEINIRITIRYIRQLTPTAHIPTLYL